MVRGHGIVTQLNETIVREKLRVGSQNTMHFTTGSAKLLGPLDVMVLLK
jgi:hypothetical protein